MANRQTKRERKLEAKQRRLAEQRRAERRQKMRKVYTLVTVLLIGGLVYGLFWFSGLAERRRIAAVNSLVAPAACSDVVKPSYKGRDHINPPTPGSGYSSEPPVSGPHYSTASAPAPTGVHTQPLQKEQFIHNLEHSHIGIFYKSGLAPQVKAALEEFVNARDEWAFMTPYETMPQTLAIAGWTRLITCQSPTDADAVVALSREFYDRFHKNGGFEKGDPFVGSPIAGTPLQP